LGYSFAPDEWSDAFRVDGELFSAEAAAQPDASAQPETPARPRVAPRKPVDITAGARRAGGSGVNVRLTDLSTHGFCMETHLLLEPGTDVWLRLPSLEMRHARVAWTRGALVGCAFDPPLSPFVVDLVVSRARTP
jgi:hypothetical protein